MSGIGAGSDPSIFAEFRALAAPAFPLHGLNFSPYTDVGEDPDYGPGQVTPAELLQRMSAVSPYTDWIRTFGSTGDLAIATFARAWFE
ncbi:MAG: hypothetical protein HQ581_09295 [Planctomycetes bacterium]|nr:hypothetical protein [Planctomycetota bacterium]